MKKHFVLASAALALLLLFSACGGQTTQKAPDEPSPYFTVQLDNETADQIKSVSFFCCFGEQEIAATSMKADDTVFLNGGSISTPVYAEDLPQNADLSDFSVTFRITDGVDAAYALSTFYFPAEYGQTYRFYLTFENGAFRILSGDASAQHFDYMNTNTSQPCGTLLYGGEEIEVSIIISDDKISLYSADAEQELIAVLPYKYSMQNAADAFSEADFTDYDGDGYSEINAKFTFSDGETADLLWWYSDGGYYYNEEFSYMPGEGSAKGD